MASWHPHSAYAGLQKSLQQEWRCNQRVVDDVGDHFAPVEKAIRDKFLPASLFGEPELKDDYRRPLSALPVKYSGLAISDPTLTAAHNHKTSSLVCGHLVQAMRSDSNVTAM